MEQQVTNSSLRKVRTFADDVRRAQAGTTVASLPLTKATSIVAPTITERSNAGIMKPVQSPTKGFLGGMLDGDLLDIRNAEKGTEEATIVSERKAKKWSFTSAIKESFLLWWQETMAELKPEQKAVPRVAPSGTRSAIVRAASMDAKIAPKDDTASLMPRLKNAIEPVVTAPKIDDTPKWGNVGATQNFPPATSEPQVIPKVARPVVRPPIIVPQPEEQVVSAVPEFRAYSSAPIRVPEETAEPISESPHEIFEEIAVPDDSIRAREEAIREESARFALRAREAATRRKEYENENRTSTGASKYFVYAILVLVGIFIVVTVAGIAYRALTSNTSVVVSQKPGISMLFEVSDSIPVTLLSDRTDFIADLTERVRDAQASPGSFLRYYFVYEGEDAELPSQAFIDTLDLRAPGSFLRTIDETMMFGAYTGTTNAPFLVLKVKNFEDALGGMLLFEKNLNSDLAPLFGDNLERTGQTGVFRDEIVGGIDTRSLYDDYGNMVVTYAFIDKNTIVITTSYSALGALAQVLK